mgnify:CR=1 FL=1|tara:strand:+ start:328 stop:540 length:213 start_codon:yes stop_codon:yes gene_type:complete
MMKAKIVRGIADALDRVGVTLVALCIIGTWFTEQISGVAGVVGFLLGGATIVLGVYNKAKIDTAEEEKKL